MKKVVAICLMMAMVFSLNATVLAAPDTFVSSPSGNAAPGIVDFVPESEDCTAELVITPYGERNELPDTLKNLFEKAYDEIVASDDLSTLNTGLADIVKNNNLDSKLLAVSDLFDIHVTGCDFHDGHVDFDVVLDADTLSHFVALLHMNKDGVWEIVEDAQVVNNGNHLKFSVESFSPFAVVVDNAANGGVDAPQTGDNRMIHVYAITMAVSAAALGYIFIKIRKQKSL